MLTILAGGTLPSRCTVPRRVAPVAVGRGLPARTACGTEVQTARARATVRTNLVRFITTSPRIQNSILRTLYCLTCARQKVVVPTLIAGHERSPIVSARPASGGSMGWPATFRSQLADVESIAKCAVGGELRVGDWLRPVTAVGKHCRRAQADSYRQCKREQFVHVRFLFVSQRPRRAMPR